MTPAAIVSKLWNYCNVLRDDGMSYGDYVEQLTYLLFLKMADERTKPPYNQPSAVPVKYNWPTLLKKDGDDLFDHYRHRCNKPRPRFSDTPWQLPYKHQISRPCMVTGWRSLGLEGLRI